MARSVPARAASTTRSVSRAASGYLMPQWLADHGFIVVSVDGRGTPRRGRSWERAIRGDLIGPALADHVAALHVLCAEHPEMDCERLGVTGWSFGGYYSVLAVERAPDTYRAALAGAPVVDWRDYDTAYTERYLGLPQADSLAYARSSALTDAAKLTRPLLVMHGDADETVPERMGQRLFEAANDPKRYVVFPGAGHTDFGAIIGALRSIGYDGFLSAEILPLPHFLRLIHGIMLRGAGIAELWRDVAALVAFTAVMIAAT